MESCTGVRQLGANRGCRSWGTAGVQHHPTGSAEDGQLRGDFGEAFPQQCLTEPVSRAASAEEPVLALSSRSDHVTPELNWLVNDGTRAAQPQTPAALPLGPAPAQSRLNLGCRHHKQPCGALLVLTELSPFLGMAGFRGKRMSLERYSFSRCTLACSDSVDLLRRRGSTEMPIVRANFLLMPASCRERDSVSTRRLQELLRASAGARAQPPQAAAPD